MGDRHQISEQRIVDANLLDAILQGRDLSAGDHRLDIADLDCRRKLAARSPSRFPRPDIPCDAQQEAIQL